MKELFERLAERMLGKSDGMTIGMDGPTDLKSNTTANPVRQSLAAQAAGKKLHDAVVHGDAALVKQLIELGADVSIKDSGGRTPLHYAVEKGHLDICDLLAKQGESAALARAQARTSTAHANRTKQAYLSRKKLRNGGPSKL